MDRFLKFFTDLLPLILLYPRWAQVIFSITLALFLFSLFILLVLYPTISKKTKPTAKTAITDTADPIFVIDKPFIRSSDPIIIRADNASADRDIALNIEFDGILYTNKGIPFSSTGKQHWKFTLDDQNVTEEMLSNTTHQIRMGFVGEQLSNPRKIIFNDPTEKATISEAVHTASIETTDEKILGKGGLLDGRRVSEGNVKGLTILVEFQDVSASLKVAEVDKLLNAEGYDKQNSTCSVREYFKIVSNGKLDYLNIVVGPVKLTNNRNFYSQKSLAEEALDLAIRDFNIDLSGFDSKNEGIVDAINFIYAGSPAYSGYLWPHTHVVNYSHNGIKTNYYSISALGTSIEDFSIGSFCHNAGHMLCRFPDLYDYGNRDGDSKPSQGMGIFCLMSAGSYLNQGRTPSPVCAYLRDLVGWPDNEVLLNIPGKYEANHGDYNTLFKYKTNNPNEYFLIENRSQIGLDSFLPSSGLAIYHCDIYGSNEWQDATKDRHYQCALIQADGLMDLENNRNSGDKGDLWEDRAGTALSYDTSPSSKKWDGGTSGLIVRDISSAGEKMTFTTE